MWPYSTASTVLGARGSPQARSQSHLIPAACTLQSGRREARVGGPGLRYEGKREGQVEMGRSLKARTSLPMARLSPC